MVQRYYCYSALIGDYDLPPTLAAVDPRIDYVLCADRLAEAPAPWRLVRVASYFRDQKVTVGFLKTNPELLFEPDAKVVWVDANLRDIKLNVERIEGWLATAPIASIPHRYRKSVREELAEVFRVGLEDDIAATRLMAEMREAGFADNGGLWNISFLVRDLGDHRVRRADRLWWDAILGGARRDQISFPFALWSAGLSCAEIDVDWMRDNDVYSRVKHANEATRHLPPRSFAPEEIERRWRAFEFPSSPDGYPRPPYCRERWTAALLRVLRDLNEGASTAGDTAPGCYCHVAGDAFSVLTPPDPRLSWKREVLRAASRAGYRALDIGFDSGDGAAIMLDANPLLHITAIAAPNGRRAPTSAAILERHFPTRFVYRQPPVAMPDGEAARPFDVVHVGARAEGDAFAWTMQHAMPGCCVIVEDACGATTARAIDAAVAAGALRPAALPIPCAAENRAFFKLI